MKNYFFPVLFLIFCINTSSGPPDSPLINRKLVIYQVPEGELISEDYSVEINGKPAGIMTARVNDPPNSSLDYGGRYSFVSFDFSGRVTIRIKSRQPLEMLEIRPRTTPVVMKIIDENTAELTISKPCQLSFEPEGKRHPLLIFANPPEENIPDKDDPNVIWFGPGIHKPEGSLIKLKSNQTLYLEGGAIVQAAVNIADVENVSIQGRGMLDATPWDHKTGKLLVPQPQHFFVDIIRSKNIQVEGITIRGSYSWTLVTQGSENVTVDNIKICGARVKNDDGIDPCNTRHMVIKNSFIRSDDDCIAIKGQRNELGDVDDILVENMVLWNDRSMIARFGVESRTPNMTNIVFRNIDIIHYGRQAFVFEPLDNTLISEVLIENVRIEGDGQKLLISIMPVVHPYYPKRVQGRIGTIHFRGIRLTGAWGDYGYPDMSSRTVPEYTSLSHPYNIEVGYYDDDHLCRDVIFEDFTILGKKLNGDSQRLLVTSGSTVTVK